MYSVGSVRSHKLGPPDVQKVWSRNNSGFECVPVNVADAPPSVRTPFAVTHAPSGSRTEANE